jgi:hypothetical protein
MARVVDESAPKRVRFKPFRLVLEFTDPDDAEHFLLGMIVARSNNRNETIVDIIDGINGAMIDYRAQKLAADMAARA